MDDKSVSYAVYESVQIRHERTVKRFIIALIIAILVILLNNVAWIWAWCQYDYVGTETQSEITVDGTSGVAQYIGNDGDATNG